ncbi:DAK2 domain-containing protein, partial [Roseivivax isoporae]
MTGDIDSARIILWLDLSAQALDAARAALSDLDGAVGDGDHGRSMAEGMAAAAAAVRARGDAAPAELFRDAGSAFLGRVGATVGPLYASAFFRCAGAAPTVPALLGAICDGIAARGGAKPGDCTMVDAWHPAARAARAASDR